MPDCRSRGRDNQTNSRTCHVGISRRRPPKRKPPMSPTHCAKTREALKHLVSWLSWFCGWAEVGVCSRLGAFAAQRPRVQLSPSSSTCRAPARARRARGYDDHHTQHTHMLSPPSLLHAGTPNLATCPPHGPRGREPHSLTAQPDLDPEHAISAIPERDLGHLGARV